MNEFEDGLWERLVDEHDADRVSLAAPRASSHSRRPLIVGGGAAGLAAAGAAVVLGIGAVTSAPPAYAMTQNADGTVTVTINDLADSVAAVNAKFAAMGINETVVPVTASCPDTGNSEDELLLDPDASANQSLNFTPGWKPDPGYQGIVAAEQLPDGQVAMSVEAVQPPIPTCFPATAYKMVQSGDDNGTPVYKLEPATP